MRPERAADHSLPSSAAVMEEYSYTSTHPQGHIGPVAGSLYFLPPDDGQQICPKHVEVDLPYKLRINNAASFYFTARSLYELH